MVKKGRERFTPCLFYPANSPMNLYAIVLLMSHSRANESPLLQTQERA